ncbi:protein cordon-bleu isoform X2 [Chaetodon trifascialis]|uniref:protein cordon-bleu isoform X2 n=1 Tax=Chaetodon trifascialis TaxID=109706 RepID=UPI003992C37D
MTESSKPPSGRRMKARAPPPPQAPQPAPRHIFRNTVPDGGGTSGMDTKENILRPTVDLLLTLPQGYQTSVTEDGSKPLMDLLIELCSRYHLNPTLHNLELLSPEGHTLGFKPNALLGSLNVACVLIKEKVSEEKVVRKPAPKVPEKTVRLMVNYHGSQKAVFRVNPLVPLQALIPIICDKCEFDPAHVLLLKDSISRRELPLNQTLTDLGIKELYAHDQRLVLLPKMASVPALYHSGTICSSTTSLGRAEKKGLLGIFQLRKKKTKGLSAVSGVPNVEDRPNTLGQSQSVMNITKMSPKAESKKRRAPTLPGSPSPAMGHTSFEDHQIGIGAENQQRKRKAPAPPPTPSSITPGPDDTSASATDSHTTDTTTPAFHTKVAQSTTVSATTVVRQTVKPVPLKRTLQPPPVSAANPTPSSPTPSSSTTDSLAVQDSSSELSHSLGDSDVDLDQTGSQCSSLTSSTVSGAVQVQPATKSSSSRRMEELEKASSLVAKSNQEATSDRSSRSETESALNLKLDEVENNRHSAMAWLHSMQSSTASGQKPETETPEEETVSLGSSSGDQGYAASEGMTEGEDSGMVSSPSDTQPTSPDGSLSLDGSSGGGGQRLLGPVRDNSSDSDEGCATWGSSHRHNCISPQAKSDRLKHSYEDDPELTAQLHQTLADFEADLADHIGIVSVEETCLVLSSDNNEVPVSVVDMDVPVTAIDEVVEDYGRKSVEKEAKSQTLTESAGSKGPGYSHQSSVEPQNRNSNASDSNKSSSADTANKQPEKHQKSLKNKSKGDKKEKKLLETKVKGMSIADTKSVKKDKQRTTTAVKSNVDMQKHSKDTEIMPDPVKSKAQSFQEKKPAIPPAGQRAVSVERDEEMHGVNKNNSSSSASHGKITHNITSRFGLKTFTVIPPKPSVLHAATETPPVTITYDAIKIDDQGNMVGAVPKKVGGSSESEMNYCDGSSLLGKAKAFWSSNERQESAVPHNKGRIDKAKECTDGLKSSTPTAVSETTLKNSNTWEIKMMQTSLQKPAERAHPKEKVKEEAQEPAKDIKVAKDERVEVESKISVSKHVQQPTYKTTLPPSVLPDPGKDLSFLKPSRRTSSQYVASALTKYTPKTSAKPNSIPNIPESSAALKTQTIGFQRSGWSMQVNPHQSSKSLLSDNKENESAFKSSPPGPKKSMSFPEYVSDSQRDFGEVRPDRGGFGSYVGSIKGNSNTLETTKHIQSSGPTQINMTANNDRDNIKHICPRSPSPAQSSPPHSSAKPPTTLKTAYQGQTNNQRDMPKVAVHLAPDVKPQPSVTAADSGVPPGPPPVTVFGPVKKFRPVICKSVEKETSLHSSLMEAIQTGGGRDRLRKITTSGPSSMKKASYVEEENERSALLAAIRAQRNSRRLKKTKSEAADELEKFRKASDEEGNAGPPSSPSLTCTSPPVFTPPPPPPAPMIAPPPPPPVLLQGKPSTVSHSSANAPMNPALAREAMLEAIRSGSAAGRLRKVAVPTKTVKVNSRLGTIQAISSTLPQQ